MTTTYTYDALNRLQQLQTKDSSGSVISAFTYTLYPTGHRHTITDHRGSVSTYIYDELYRLAQETINHPVKGTVINSYTYDAVGNRLSSTENGVTTSYSYDANDRMTQSGSTGYTYDSNGNMVKQSVPSPFGSTTTTYKYDARDKLVSVTKPDPYAIQDPFDPFPGPGPGMDIEVASFSYDADGDRISKSELFDPSVPYSAMITYDYTVDKNLPYAQVVQEHRSGDKTIYTHGDDLVSQERSNAYGSFMSYYNYDGLGSTRSLTDSGGSVTDTYDYNAYGTVLAKTGNSENSYLFTGEQYDAGTKQYYLRARYYDPGSGRFTQMDRWLGNKYTPVSLNKYLYANANPANGIDPSGYITLMDVSVSGTQVSFGNVARYATLLNQVVTGLDKSITVIEMGRAIRKVLSNKTITKSVKSLRKTGMEPRFRYHLSNPEEGLDTLFSHLPEIVKNITKKGLTKNFLSNKRNNLLIYGPSPEFKSTPWPSTGTRIFLGKIRLAKSTRKVFVELGSSKKHRGRFIGVGNTQGSSATSHEQWFRMDYHNAHGSEDATWGNYHVHYGNK